MAPGPASALRSLGGGDLEMRLVGFVDQQVVEAEVIVTVDPPPTLVSVSEKPEERVIERCGWWLLVGVGAED